MPESHAPEYVTNAQLYAEVRATHDLSIRQDEKMRQVRDDIREFRGMYVELNKRIVKLEKFRWKVIGITAGYGVIITALETYVSIVTRK